MLNVENTLVSEVYCSSEVRSHVGLLCCSIWTTVRRVVQKSGDTQF